MPYVVVSILLHGVLLAFVWWADRDSEQATRPAAPALVASPVPKPVPEVVAVDARKVEALKKTLEARKRAEEQQRKKLARELAALKKKKEAEKQRLREAQKRRKAEEARRKKAELERKKKEAEARKAEALAREKQKALEEEQARLREIERKKKEAEEQRRKEEMARQVEEELARQLRQEQQALASQQRQAQVADETEKYTTLIRNRIYAAWTVGDDAVVKVKLAPGGLVTDIQCVEGTPTACQDAVRAVRKAEPLPVSRDPEVFQNLREIIIRLKREPNAGVSQ
jgi:colicin import membrane protein